jgi:undecaprenyl-diphosphatase
MKKIILSIFLLILFPFSVSAGSGPLGIDHRISRSDTGIWSRNNQLFLEYSSMLVDVGGSLWFGSDSRMGKTFWQSTDSMAITALSSVVGKETFRRERPNHSNDPNAWFQSSTDRSFPSGEVAHITSVITPFIVEYHNENPYVWSLTALPIYDGIARMKSQAHWQTDVLAGAALGATAGVLSSSRETPLSVLILPHSVTVGLHKIF